MQQNYKSKKIGIWEPDQTEITIEILQAESLSTILFIDVWAQLGYYSFIAASLGSRCVAIEANRNVFNALCKGITTNDFDKNIMAINTFCGKKFANFHLLGTESFDSRTIMKVDIEGLNQGRFPLFIIYLRTIRLKH